MRPSRTRAACVLAGRWGRQRRRASAVFALSEAGGSSDRARGPSPVPTFMRSCRAELRVDSPGGPWTVRLASLIYDEPAAVVWMTNALLVVKYGFLDVRVRGTNGRASLVRTGRRRRLLVGHGRRPLLPHALCRDEIETFALEADGDGRVAGGPQRRRDRRRSCSAGGSC